MTINKTKSKKKQPHILTPRLVTVFNLQKKKQTSRAHYKKNATKKLTACERYSQNKESICALKRDKYALSEPKPVTKDAYLKDLENNLLGNKKSKGRLV